MKKQKHNDRPKSGALALFTQYPKQAITVIMLTAGGTLAFNTFTTYLQKYLVNTSGFEKTTATANTLFGGTAERVALSFKNAGHENHLFYFITFMIGLSLITYIFMKDTKKHSRLPTTKPSVFS